jgi:(p)ppGpp synthase/HD superfamily hydrolase
MATQCTELTSRFTEALDYAREAHTGFRKGTQVPYMAHLLGVASLVLAETGYVEFPVTEDLVIAALLHVLAAAPNGSPAAIFESRHCCGGGGLSRSAFSFASRTALAMRA